jgi:hypothetical protein
MKDRDRHPRVGFYIRQPTRDRVNEIKELLTEHTGEFASQDDAIWWMVERVEPEPKAVAEAWRNLLFQSLEGTGRDRQPMVSMRSWQSLLQLRLPTLRTGLVILTGGGLKHLIVGCVHSETARLLNRTGSPRP